MSSIRSALPTSFSSEVMTLPLVKPVAASLTSSKTLFEVGHFGLAHGFLELPLEFGGHLARLAHHCPTMRSTAGSSFGPMAISATTAMTTSSSPCRNLKISAHARLEGRSRFSPLLQAAPQILSTACCRRPSAPLSR